MYIDNKEQKQPRKQTNSSLKILFLFKQLVKKDHTEDEKGTSVFKIKKIVNGLKKNKVRIENTTSYSNNDI